MKIIQEEYVFTAPVRFNVLPKKVPQRFSASDTTPSVLNNDLWIANNTGAVTITQFDFGADGQEITILGDGFTTVQAGINIFTNTGANKLLLANRLYRFVHIEGFWYEQ